MENPIPASLLNDYIFCPASIYFHKLYYDMDNRVYQRPVQIAGSDAHLTVDNNNYSTRKDVITSLDAYSEEYNLTCKIDLYYKNEKKIVERKNKIHKIYDGQVFQVYAQYFCLKEMGYGVNSIEIYSMQDNKKYKIELPEKDNAMYGKFVNTINEIVNFNINDFIQTNVEKCKNCIYEPACDRTLIKDIKNV